MLLLKRLFRNLRKNISFFLCSTILCGLTVAFIISITSTGMFIHDETLRYYDETNVEDACFSTFQDISDDINKIEDKFNVDIEPVEYDDEELDGYDLRIFNQSQNINKYVVQEGEDLADDNDILINRFIADAHNIKIGDTLKIANQKYSIKGYFVRPDYTYMLQNLDDTFLDTDSFGIAMLTDEGLAKLDNKITYYSVVFENDNSISDFRNYINDNYTMKSYISSDNNKRIGYVVTEGLAISMMARNFSPLFFVLIIAIIVVLLKRIVKKDIREVGLLSALGYRKSEIITYYSSYGVFAGLIGSLLGIILGMKWTEPVTKFYCVDLALPEVKATYYIPGILIALVVPMLVFVITSRLTVRSILKHNVIQILNNDIGHKKRIFRGYTGDNMKMKNKFRIRLLLQNRSRTIAFTLGIFVASILLVTSFLMKSSVSHFVNDTMDEQIKYENIYYLNAPQTDTLDENGEKFSQKALEVVDLGTNILILGISADSNYYDLKNEEGKSVNLKDGNYITLAYAMQTGYGAGDVIECINPITLQEYSIKIKGVVDITSQSCVFMENNRFNKLFERETGTYDGLMSNVKLTDLDESYVYSEQEKEQIVKNLEEHMEILVYIEYILIILGVILSVIIICTLSNMLIDESKENIIMFKVLGYRRGEINSIVLNVNILLLVIGFIPAVFAAKAFCSTVYASQVETVGVYVDTVFSTSYIVPGFLIILLSYLFSMLLLRNKVEKVDLIASLKEL
ncbi:MAG: FtsX-like permease family protein [Pseudobutyrivibrio sp.]|nr:FtsX-like permease family protein [Pseudobutyrivibrio sp.]